MRRPPLKIGILAQYLDTRNDIRDLIIEMNRHASVCVFVHGKDIKYASLLPDIEFREIRVRSKSSLWNGFVKYLFFFFGEIPSSKKNYFFAERTKLKHGNQSVFKVLEKHLSLIATHILPILSYDVYLRVLWYKNDTDLHDIDTILGITEIYDDRFMSVLLKHGKPVSLYVYSWDHPCKMKTFPKNVQQYYVWNDGLQQDLIALQNIAGKKIRQVGSTQLSYILDYRKYRSQDIGFSYYYFGCAFGYKELVEEEIHFIRKIAREMSRIDPSLKLVVRPYPFLKDWHVYDCLKSLANVHMDDHFRSEENKFYLTRDEILRKFHWIANAQAFIHFGTTMGMEAAYFDTPIIHIAYANDKVFFDLIHQYHTDKYLILDEFPNIVNSDDGLRKALHAVKTSKSDFMKYNREVASRTPLRSMDEIASGLVNLLRDT